MGFFDRLDKSGPFINAWQARYGSLSRAQLVVMRDQNLGFFTAWTDLEGKTDWSVDQFIGSFSSWATPGETMFEYLLAYRLTVRSPDTKEGFIMWSWRNKVGAIADYYPPGQWGDEWGRAVRAGTRKRGTRDGRVTGPGEVILGADAMALAAEQMTREEVIPA